MLFDDLWILCDIFLNSCLGVWMADPTARNFSRWDEKKLLSKTLGVAEELEGLGVNVEGEKLITGEEGITG